jgi:hypothetical protein
MPRRGKQQDRLNRSHLLGGVLVEIFYAPLNQLVPQRSFTSTAPLEDYTLSGGIEIRAGWRTDTRAE